MYLFMSDACPGVSAVPSEATAWSNPAWCMAMTSIYPSHIIMFFFRELLAKLSPNRFLPLSNIFVSGELRYLGSPSPMTLPPNPITLLDIFIMGNIALLKNLSLTSRSL